MVHHNVSIISKEKEKTLEHIKVNAETVLEDYSKSIKHRLQSNKAIHIYISKLQKHNQSDENINLTINTFETFVKTSSGLAFFLHNNDLLILIDDCSEKEIFEAILRLRFLYHKDPLIQNEEQFEKNLFYKLIDIKKDQQDFQNHIQHIVDEYNKIERDNLTSPLTKGKKPEKVDLGDFNSFEKIIAKMDISSVLKRQPICIYGDEWKNNIIFHEVYVSIDALQETLNTPINLHANRWLFQYLTHILDSRVLSHLSKQKEKKDNICINLNMSTIMSDAFLEFDERILRKDKKTIIIELQHLDILSDFEGFLFIRDLLHEKGYRISLDGISYHSLNLLSREKIGFDFIKLLWNNSLKFLSDDNYIKALKDKILEIGTPRVILCRSESPDAINFGRNIGIALFQGFAVDRMIKAEIQNDPSYMTMKEAIARGREKVL